MAESPSKRRRLSADAEDEPSTAPRPSFTSPTKASLARFNPRLLPKSPRLSASGVSGPPRRRSQRNSLPPEDNVSETISGRPRRVRLEPELPPTPEALGLAPRPAQPQGLLSSSPAQRASKRKVIKTSPLRPRQTNVVQPVEEKETSQAESDAIEADATLRRLRERLQLVKDDVVYLERATEALHASDGKSLGFVSENKLLSILTSSDPDHERPLSTAIPLSTKLAQFLPFSRPRPPHIAAEIERIGAAPLHDAYRPVEAEELAKTLGIEPRIQLTTRRRIALDTLHSSPLITQRHISLTDAAALFRMDLTASVADDKVIAVDITALSPWADAEFGPWARAIAKVCDLPALGRGFAAYSALSVARATCWARCAARHGDLLHDPSPSEPKSDGDLATPSRSDVHAHLGRTALQLTRGGASLLLRWTIALDWTGTPASHVAADCAVPAKWRDADTRGSLALVGDAFRRLVRNRGVEGAVDVMVAVLLGREEEDDDDDDDDDDDGRRDGNEHEIQVGA